MINSLRIPGPAMLVVLVAALVATACSAGDTRPAPSPFAGKFPVSIQHKFGVTAITAEPRRVLSVGYQDHDAILALGVKPVAARYWFGDENDVIFPWVMDAAGDADPEILKMSDGLDFERIAALRPDLIVGVYSGLTARDHQLLSKIAPTLAQPAGYIDYGTPWDVQTRMIGRALGRADRAEELIADVEGRFQELRGEHPEWAGRSVVVSTYGAEGTFGAFASEDPRSRFFTSLGFTVPAEIDALAGDTFYVDISPERADLIDADLLVWDQLSYTPGGRATVEANPLVQQLKVTRQGRALHLTEDIEFAFAFNSVLSLPFVLNGIEKSLEAATDGDPATTP